MRRRPLILALAVGLLAATVLASTASAGGKRFVLALDSDNEAPPPAGVSTSGTGLLTINPGTGEVCFFFEISGTNMGTVTSAHIHEAPVGVSGPVVVPLTLNGCATFTDRAQLIEIFANPDDYYVNVHSTTAAPPTGIGRDQLSHSGQ
jgi:hypothetical protein